MSAIVKETRKAKMYIFKCRHPLCGGDEDKCDKQMACEATSRWEDAIVADGILKFVESSGSALPNKDGGHTDPELFNCVWIRDGEYSVPTTGTPYGMKLSGYTPFLPMVISETEKPVDGDYVFYKNGSYLRTSPKFSAEEAIRLGWFKVIVTPQQLSARLIVKNKFRENDPVLVVCDESYKSRSHEAMGSATHSVALDKDNQATILKATLEEIKAEKNVWQNDQKFTLEQLKSAFDNARVKTGGGGQYWYENFEEWFAENVKK
jgi:hypothetical protein